MIKDLRKWEKLAIWSTTTFAPDVIANNVKVKKWDSSTDTKNWNLERVNDWKRIESANDCNVVKTKKMKTRHELPHRDLFKSRQLRKNHCMTSTKHVIEYNPLIQFQLNKT